MKIKDFWHVNPLIFISTIIVQLLVPALSLLTVQVGIYQVDAIQQVNLPKFLKLTALNFVLLAVSYIVEYLFDYLLAKQKEQYKVILRTKIINRLCYTKQEYSIAQIQNFLTNDLIQSEENYLDAFMSLIGGLGYVVSALVMLFSIHWIMLVVISLMIIISLLLPKLTEKPLQKAIIAISDNNKKYLDTISKWLTGIEELQRYFSGSHLFAVLSKSSRKLEHANVKEAGIKQCLKVVNEIAAQFMLLVLYAVTGYLIVSKQIAFGVISVVSDLKYYLSSGIELITEARGDMAGVSSLNRQIENLASPIVKPEESSSDLEEVDEIVTDNLQIAFPNGESIQLPNIKVKPGQKILLTGESGVGKSTLLKIMAGELRPSSGRVIYRGKKGTLTHPDVSKIGYLPQDAILFPVSINDNITMFDDRIAPMVPTLVKDMQLQQDVDEQKLSLQTIIDLNKLNISGGQRQKIVLARALIHQSKIILIDEGTSAIDAQATIKVLQKIMKTNASVVFIAHNLNQEMKKLFDYELRLVKSNNKIKKLILSA